MTARVNLGIVKVDEINWQANEQETESQEQEEDNRENAQ